MKSLGLIHKGDALIHGEVQTKYSSAVGRRGRAWEAREQSRLIAAAGRIEPVVTQDRA